MMSMAENVLRSLFVKVSHSNLQTSTWTLPECLPQSLFKCRQLADFLEWHAVVLTVLLLDNPKPSLAMLHVSATTAHALQFGNAGDWDSKSDSWSLLLKMLATSGCAWKVLWLLSFIEPAQMMLVFPGCDVSKMSSALLVHTVDLLLKEDNDVCSL